MVIYTYTFDNYEQYEEACDKMRKQNEEYLKLFEEDMIDKGLSPKTITRHLNNVDFFLNTYLLRERILTMQEGLLEMDIFFDFFIHKCMWSSPSTIKTTAASFKKFYKSMADHELIPKEDLWDFNEKIKFGVPGWIDDLEYFMSDDYVPYW